MARSFVTIATVLTTAIMSVKNHGVGGQPNPLMMMIANTSYNSNIRPGANTEPITVYVGLFIRSISISDTNMDFQISLYLRQTWVDNRLALAEHPTYTLNHAMTKDVWTPEVFFSNEKEGRLHEVTVPNRIVRISRGGHMLFSQRYRLQLSCPMQLQQYPMDTQVCPIEIESYGYATRDMNLQWLPTHPIELKHGLTIAEFTLKGVNNYTYSASYTTGKYSGVVAELRVDRVFAFYLHHVYVPTFLIVGLSWIGFWIDYRSAPARVSLGVITVLTMTTQSSSSLIQIPRVAHNTAMDVWMTTCLAFVYGAFLQYAVVQGLMGHERMDSMQPTSSTPIATHAEPSTLGPHNGTAPPPTLPQTTTKHVTLQDRVMIADHVARYLFPLGFVIFNIVYWIYYK